VPNASKQLHGHYYHLKKVCRKKSQPLYVYRLADDFKEQQCLKFLHVDSVDELKETAYILVNEDGLRLPQPAEGGDVGVSEMFLRNPTQISNIDELYDLFDLNRGNSTKYILCMKQKD